MNTADTIYALASGAAQAGIAVLRISGEDAGRVVREIAGPLPEPRRASLRSLRDEDGRTLDRGLVLWFAAPHSYTGEDLGELHVHGGSAVLAAIEARLRALGARPAGAGEFTRRAFLRGRIDLVEAEGIADLIAAETEEQRRQAIEQAEGALSRVYAAWAERLRRLLARAEAAVDFPDEAGDEDLATTIGAPANALADEMQTHLAAGVRPERLRSGVTVCVTGAPNVGKSSLVNRLAGGDISIVSAEPGTTRDPIETRIVLGGVAVTLIDTAGLREAVDEIEAEGVRRARARADTADLVLEVVAGPGERPPSPANVLRVVNKIDLGVDAEGRGLGVSARTGAGLADLRNALEKRVRAVAARAPSPVMTNARHRACIEDARSHLREAADAAAAELRGEELRLAMRAIGRLTGKVGVEDLLDTIFSSFCIGK